MTRRYGNYKLTTKEARYYALLPEEYQAEFMGLDHTEREDYMLNKEIVINKTPKRHSKAASLGYVPYEEWDPKLNKLHELVPSPTPEFIKRCDDVASIAGSKDAFQFNLTAKNEEAVAFVLRLMNSLNKGVSKDEFFKRNIIIDSSEAISSEDEAAGPGELGFLPPFETGSYCIEENERCHDLCDWEVIGFDEDDRTTSIRFNSYVEIGYKSDTCWFQDSTAVVEIKSVSLYDFIESMVFDYSGLHDICTQSQNKSTRLREIARRIDGMRETYMNYDGGDIFSYSIKQLEYQMPWYRSKVLRSKRVDENGEPLSCSSKDVKDVVDSISLDKERQLEIRTNIFNIVNGFFKLNCTLNNPNRTRVMGKSVTYTTSIADDIGSDDRKERIFGNVKVVSSDKPKLITVDNIRRVYKTLSWNKRSHIRRLKSGKTIVIPSQVCHRHLDDKEENDVVPQTIYRRGRKS